MLEEILTLEKKAALEFFFCFPNQSFNHKNIEGYLKIFKKKRKMKSETT
jgi:hypothetical protein